MKTSVIQSLIDRNANKITNVEFVIRHCKNTLKDMYKDDIQDGYKIDFIKSSLSKHRQTLKKLVAIQKELKKELADNIRNENSEAIYFDIYEGVN